MMLCRPCLLFFLLLGSLPTLYAQQNYRVERFTTDNGLPSNGIKGLEWDEGTGFLWIATEAGVTRYNGTDFSTFPKVNTPQLFSERMLLMLKNLAGRIYTIDEAGNIFSVMQNRLQFLDRVPLDTRSSTVRLIGLASSGQLFRQSASQPPSNNFGFNCARDILMPVSDTHVLIYHTDTLYGFVPGLYDYSSGIKEPVLVTPLEKNARLFRLAGQLFVFTGQHRFFRLDIDSNRLANTRLVAENRIPGLSKEGIEQLFWENGMTQPVVISGSRAWLLDYADRRLIARLICEAVPTDAMLSYAQYAEKNGILFLGTNSRGIVLIRKIRVRPVNRNPPDITETTACYSQLALPNGSIM